MKRILLNLSYILLASLLFVSCADDNEEPANDPLTGLTKLSEGYAIGASAKVEIWGMKNYFVGFNSLVVVLNDSLNTNEKMTNATIAFKPVMTMKKGMATMTHACPIENPSDAAVDNVFEGAVVFQMATVVDGTWKLGVSVHNLKNDKIGEVVFDVVVDNSDPSVCTVFTSQSADSTKLVLSLLEPANPKIGMNDIAFTIHKKLDMMNFPADDTYTIEIEPEMPSMGHGSPNNVNPESTGNGHYNGKVNFTMTGEWKVNVLVKKDGKTISKNAYFNITF